MGGAGGGRRISTPHRPSTDQRSNRYGNLTDGAGSADGLHALRLAADLEDEEIVRKRPPAGEDRRRVAPTPRHVAILRGLVEAHGVAGNLTTDAHLAALALEHGAELVTFDRDILRFGVKLELLA
jgi:PIN domain